MEDQASSRTVAILIDHHIEGQAAWLWDTLKAAGWLELLQLDMVMFADVGLAATEKYGDLLKLIT